MTAQTLLLAAHEWLTIHQRIHGELSRQERETVFECVEFLCAVAQTDSLPTLEGRLPPRL